MDNLRASKFVIINFKATDENVAITLDGLQPGTNYTAYITAEDKTGKRLMFETQTV